MPECRFLLTRFCPCTGRYRSTKNPCSRICFTVLCQRGVHMSSAEAYSEPYTTPNLVTYFAKSPILDVWQSFWLHLFSEALIKNEPLYFQSSIISKGTILHICKEVSQISERFWFLEKLVAIKIPNIVLSCAFGSLLQIKRHWQKGNQIAIVKTNPLLYFNYFLKMSISRKSQ